MGCVLAVSHVKHGKYPLRLISGHEVAYLGPIRDVWTLSQHKVALTRSFPFCRKLMVPEHAATLNIAKIMFPQRHGRCV